MELYPRIGKNFDIKVFTNCRFGMMSWAVLAVTYCIKQVNESSLIFLFVLVVEVQYFTLVAIGQISINLLVTLMVVNIFKAVHIYISITLIDGT